MARYIISRVEQFTSPTNAAKTYFRPRAAAYTKGRPWWAHYKGTPAVGSWCVMVLGDGFDLAADSDNDVLVLPDKLNLDATLNNQTTNRINNKLAAFGITFRATVGQTAREVLTAVVEECVPGFDITKTELSVSDIAKRKGQE